MQLLRRICVLILGLAMPLAITSVLRADAVTDWNAIAIQTIAGSPSHPGVTAFLDSAMVQAAVYDAVEAINGRFRPYHVHIPGATGSPAAAVAKATHDVLVSRFPSLTGSLDMTYHNYLATHGLAESDPGVRHAVYREVEEMIAREALLLPLFHDQLYRFGRPELEGLEISFSPPYVDYASLSLKR